MRRGVIRVGRRTGSASLHSHSPLPGSPLGSIHGRPVGSPPPPVYLSPSPPPGFVPQAGDSQFNFPVNGTVRSERTVKVKKSSGTKKGGVSNTNVKVAKHLDIDGINVKHLEVAVLGASRDKGCKPALLSPMPGTEEDEAAVGLLHSSIPDSLCDLVTYAPTAYHAFTALINKFVGGHSVEASRQWMATLNKGMLAEGGSQRLCITDDPYI